MYKNAVLSIWYSQNGKARKFEQGKIYQEDGKWVYLADMDDSKLWRNYNGYSIAKQLTDAFSKLKLRPRIIYRVKKTGQILTTNLSTFTGSKAILVNYGGHEQWILPIRHFKVRQEIISDPHDLPVIDLAKWSNPTPQVVFVDGGFILQ